MIYAKVNAQGRQALVTALEHSTDADWYRRLKIIDLSSQGTRVPGNSGRQLLSCKNLR